MRLLILGLLVCVAWAAAVWEDREWKLVYKTCGASGGVKEAVLEESVMRMDIVGNGYYRGNSQSVEMIGQCEEDLDACECLQCFTHALHRCPASLSAQIRLNYCSLAYSCHPNSYSYPPGGLNGNGNGTKRIAAIVVGAAVALFLVLLVLSFLRSRYSKRHYYY
ncbi:hypothetical protein QN277_021953 [Acacia crassicarpa]|uniref:Gnk2-homologous domain-containing protein n=1 Tax=Acacia crassicarpa TaxID=499986 RepID=A0AAE1MML2_9FABA|nr:hypothetical protein QN277_021953 [Acacia crassicarpa]